MNYQDYVPMSGEKCYTLTYNKEAEMYVEKDGMVIVYPSGNSLVIPRVMVEEAIKQLEIQRKLTVSDVHEKITNRNKPRTDKLMAVIRKLPGVTFDKIPRVLYYHR